MRHLANIDRNALQKGLADAGADGWLLFDFKGGNPIALRMLEIKPGSRRIFVYLPKSGDPIAIAHKIELQPVEGFPGRIIEYSSLAGVGRRLEGGCRREDRRDGGVRRDAVPYLDRVPYGVVELVQAAGGKVVSSAPLVDFSSPPVGSPSGKPVTISKPPRFWLA